MQQTDEHKKFRTYQKFLYEPDSASDGLFSGSLTSAVREQEVGWAAQDNSVTKGGVINVLLTDGWVAA